MEIVVVGAGKVGEALCFDLINEGHELILIDQKADVVLAMTEKMDLKGVVGNGTVPEVQREADVAFCDVFISATLRMRSILLLVLWPLLGQNCIKCIRNPEYKGVSIFAKASAQHDDEYRATDSQEIVEEFDFPMPTILSLLR